MDRPPGFTEKEEIPKSDSDCESSDEPAANPNHRNFVQESDDDDSTDDSEAEDDSDTSGKSSDDEQEAAVKLAD